jgi:hypothetical protein
MTQHLWEVDHPYYGPEGSFWANWSQQGPYIQKYESWQEFVDEGGMADADLDMNWCYRWDWKKWPTEDYEEDVNEAEKEQLLLFWMMPRKGIMATSTINVTEADEPAVREWLQVRADYMRSMWEPFDLSPKAGS